LRIANWELQIEKTGKIANFELPIADWKKQEPRQFRIADCGVKYEAQ
jgi:hypothetical protein